MKRVFIAILGALMILESSVMTNAATTKNLLSNGTAEKGDLTGWKATSEKWKATDGEGYGSTCVPYKGRYFFWSVNDQSSKTYLYQTVKVKKAYIGGTATLSAYMAVWPQTPTDQARLQLTFYDSKGKKISSAYKTYKTAAWKKIKVKVKIPQGTKKMRTYLVGIRKNGVVDAYFDNVSLTVKY